MTILVALGVGLLPFRYARTEVAPGYLEPRSGIAPVHAMRPGTVKALFVAEGQSVEAGDALMTIEAEQTTATGTDAGVDAVRLLASRRDRLAQQIERQREWAGIEETRTAARLSGAERELREIEAQLRLQIERADLIATRAEALKPSLDRGFISRSEYDRWVEAHLGARQSAAALRQQIVTLEAKRQDSQYALAQLPSVTEAQIRTLTAELSDVEQRLTEAQLGRAYMLRAPTGGRVSALQASPGRWVTPTAPLLSLAPLQGELVAQLLVPTRAIGHVRPGLPVRVLYEAYPHQKFGGQPGRVASVSRTVLTPPEFVGAMRLAEAAYRVTVVLDHQEVVLESTRHALHPGMQLRAAIVLDERPLWQWALSPLQRMRL